MIDDFIFIAAGASPGGEASGTIGGLLFYILIAIAVSFTCSIWEAVVLSTTIAHIEVQEELGSRAAKVMHWIKDHLEQAISAILTVNTFAHTIGAAGAGAQAVGVFGNEWFGVISAVLTLLILVFSEIIPKTLGATYWKQLLPFTAYGVRSLIVILYPLVMAFEYLGRFMSPNQKAPKITRLELAMLAEIGKDEGELQREEHIILKNLLRLREVSVGDIMTPRTVVFMLPEDMTVGEVSRLYPILSHSRIPIYRLNQDHVVGFVLRHTILAAVAEDHHEVKLKQVVLPIHSIPGSLTAAKALQEFTQRGEHIFLVLDEYGGTAGIITMEDAIESLLGIEIMDESDVVEDMRTLAKQRFDRQRKLLDSSEIVNVSQLDSKPA